jgi:hypothetical protein
MLRQIRTHARCIAPTTRVQRTIPIAHTGLGFFSLGVSKQYQAHGDSIDSLFATV